VDWFAFNCLNPQCTANYPIVYGSSDSFGNPVSAGDTPFGSPISGVPDVPGPIAGSGLTGLMACVWRISLLATATRCNQGIQASDRDVCLINRGGFWIEAFKQYVGQ
jgi:hypothetical protein